MDTQPPPPPDVEPAPQSFEERVVELFEKIESHLGELTRLGSQFGEHLSSLASGGGQLAHDVGQIVRMALAEVDAIPGIPAKAAAPAAPPSSAAPELSVLQADDEPETTAPSNDPDLAAPPELAPEDQAAPVDGAVDPASVPEEDRPAPQDGV